MADGQFSKFCVIHPMVDAQRVPRGWKDNVEDAVAHATRLIEKNHSNGQKTRRLLVVQVVKVVETPPLVTVQVRDPVPADVSKDDADDE
jgi:hypothetical protein